MFNLTFLCLRLLGTPVWIKEVAEDQHEPQMGLCHHAGSIQTFALKIDQHFVNNFVTSRFGGLKETDNAT